MKKVLQIFIAWVLVAFLAIISLLRVSGQISPPASLTGGIPVVFDGQTLFTIRNNFGAITPRGRQIRAERRIAEFAGNYAIPPEDLQINSMDEEGIPVDVIVVEDQAISFITELDARRAGKKRRELSTEILETIRSAVVKYRRARSAGMIALGILFSGLATIALLIARRVIDRLFSIAHERILAWEDTHIQAVSLGGVEIIGSNQLDNITAFATKIGHKIINLGLLCLYLAFVLKQFPWTRDLARRIWTIFFEKLQVGWQGFLVFLPNLITIGMVLAIAYFISNLFKTFFWRLRDGSLVIPSFYQDWAVPTYRLVSIGLTAITIMAIAPLLPWSQSPVFQGVGVLFGLLLSLGSSSLIANIVSGCVLIYTRAFRLGDVVTIDQTEGQVIDKNLLVTRLLTSANEVVSIPNSKIINGSIKNLNFSSQELNKPLIIKTSVDLGYEVPWRQAYEALLKAGLQMKGVTTSPPPFVYQKTLNNVYVTYVLGVYLDLDFVHGKNAKDFEQFYASLHEKVRNCCEEEGIRIFAPLYYPDPSMYGYIPRDRLS